MRPTSSYETARYCMRSRNLHSCHPAPSGYLGPFPSVGSEEVCFWMINFQVVVQRVETINQPLNRDLGIFIKTTSLALGIRNRPGGCCYVGRPCYWSMRVSRGLRQTESTSRDPMIRYLFSYCGIDEVLISADWRCGSSVLWVWTARIGIGTGTPFGEKGTMKLALIQRLQ